MKIILIPFLLVFFVSINLSAQPVKIIFDTDMESDVDDVGALSMLHGFADLGEAEILGTMVCSLNPWAVPTVAAINRYCGRPDIPIGAVKTFGVYRNSSYARIISEEFPQTIGSGENAPDAINEYRRILTSQPDNSVIIVTLGYLTNLSYLLNSSPDDINPLNGIDLIQKKVKHLVCMGDRYPVTQNPARHGNFKPDPNAIKHVAEEWPTSILFTGGGDFAWAIKTGEKTFDFDPQSNPISRAYEVFLKNTNRQHHHSADLISVYIAVRGWEDFFELNTQGYNHIFEDGTSVWRLQPDDARHQYVSRFKDGINPDKIVEVFDNLIIKPITGKAGE